MLICNAVYIFLLDCFCFIKEEMFMENKKDVLYELIKLGPYKLDISKMYGPFTIRISFLASYSFYTNV